MSKNLPGWNLLVLDVLWPIEMTIRELFTNKNFMPWKFNLLFSPPQHLLETFFVTINSLNPEIFWLGNDAKKSHGAEVYLSLRFSELKQPEWIMSSVLLGISSVYPIQDTTIHQRTSSSNPPNSHFLQAKFPGWTFSVTKYSSSISKSKIAHQLFYFCWRAEAKKPAVLTHPHSATG